MSKKPMAKAPSSRPSTTRWTVAEEIAFAVAVLSLVVAAGAAYIGIRDDRMPVMVLSGGMIALCGIVATVWIHFRNERLGGGT